jgi:hypothetical protein
MIFYLTSKLLEYKGANDFIVFSTEILHQFSASTQDKRVSIWIWRKAYRLSLLLNYLDIVIKWDDSLIISLFQDSQFDCFWREIENLFLCFFLNYTYTSADPWVTTNLILEIFSLIYTTSSCGIRCGEISLQR